MYRVGYIDDEMDSYHDYAKRFARREIELLFPYNCKTKEEISEWIKENMIKYFIVDYKLIAEFNFLGTDLVSYLNSKMPDFPCLILTNYPSDSIDENLVPVDRIESKQIFGPSGREKFDKFVEKIKHSITVFEKRLEVYEQEYSQLLTKKTTHELNSFEEERFLELFKLLRAYSEIDDLPDEFLKTEAAVKMDQLLEDVNNLIEKVKAGS